MRLWREGLALCATLLLLLATRVFAQTGTRIIDTLEPGSPSNALPSAAVKTGPGAVPSLPASTGAPGTGEGKPFALRDVRVEGADHLYPPAVKALWEAKVGQRHPPHRRWRQLALQGRRLRALHGVDPEAVL
ncbi:MAG TPA: hypothetical protein VNV38_07310 [Stellaceae bacterium]|jgi:hypothetical protein|nr:hypothetical protein [Stellaceae bacterium]